MNLLCLGAGNMASALLGPIVSDFQSFYVYSPGKSAAVFAQKFGAEVLEDLESLESDLDILVLAFKPQVFDEAVDSFLARNSSSLKNTLIVSMLAGTAIDTISRKFQSGNIVRIMPNTPSMVGHGVTLLLAKSEAKDSGVEKFKEILSKTGKVLKASTEDQFDQWTATTGSGPAYLFEIARILQNILIGQDMRPEDARIAIEELFLGSSLMMKESDLALEDLRANVTSKKGVTYEALEVFKKKNIEAIISSAIEANIARSTELKNAVRK